MISKVLQRFYKHEKSETHHLAKLAAISGALNVVAQLNAGCEEEKKPTEICC